MPDIHTRDMVCIPDLNGYTIAVYPPLYIRASAENFPARINSAEFSKDQAEILARTIAPQLLPQAGLEPWRTPIREVYADLCETVQSYSRDLRAIQHPKTRWTAVQVTDSLSGLLVALQGTLDRLEVLL